MKALTQGIKVCQIEDESFPVHSSLQWIDCDNTVTTRHTYENGVFVPPAPPIVYTEDEIAKRKFISKREDTLLMLLYKADQQLRALKQDASISKETFWNQIKNVHKNQQFFDGSF